MAAKTIGYDLVVSKASLTRFCLVLRQLHYVMTLAVLAHLLVVFTWFRGYLKRVTAFDQRAKLIIEKRVDVNLFGWENCQCVDELGWYISL